tara:strand:- start:70 stop:330 length:261 start_codon:yes stop_codon:yes gene_type:complete
MSIKKALVKAYFLEEKKNETVEFLGNQLAQAFTLLANLEPDAALQCLNQMKEQFNEQIADELLNSREEQFDKMAAQMHITEDQLDD